MHSSWQEAAMFNTTLIEAVSIADGVTKWTGTGFFLAWREADMLILFLVSNRHVLEDNPEIQYRITLHKRAAPGSGRPLRAGGNEVWIDLYDPIQITLDKDCPYFSHSSSDIDLACICCSQLLGRDDIVLVPFSQNRILDWDKSFVYPGQSVQFVGYPDDVRDRMHNLPVMRTGTFASIPALDFDGAPSFLLDAQVWEGSSGSPVFIQGGNEQVPFSVIGIIHATRAKEDGSNTNIGLGYAVKSSELVPLLQESISTMLSVPPAG
jgi:hypothetical protein